MKPTTTRNSMLLLLTAAIWGAAFVAQTTGGDAIGSYSFNCIRSLFGAIVLIPVMRFLDRNGKSIKKPQTREEYRLLWKGGICCGISLCISANLQQLGINMGASTGKAGFLTAVYILLVPILGIFLHKKCGWNVWFAVVLALARTLFFMYAGYKGMPAGRSVALVLRTGVFNPDFICGLLFTQSGWCETFCVTVFNNGSTYGNPNVLG